jgi:hypothetical protein
MATHPRGRLPKLPRLPKFGEAKFIMMTRITKAGGKYLPGTKAALDGMTALAKLGLVEHKAGYYYLTEAGQKHIDDAYKARDKSKFERGW